MPEVNNKINIELETLTPLAIGAGAEKDWVLGMDYVVDNDYLYKLNLHKIAAAGIDLQKLTSYFTEKNVRGVKDLIGQRLEEVSDFKMSMPCSSYNDIKAFVKNQLTGKPIVPGSSIKGAIRSILLEYFTSDEQTRNEMRKFNKMDECDILGKPEDGSTFMRFLKFSDFDFEQTCLVNTKIFNLQSRNAKCIGGWKHGRRNTDSTFRSEGFNTIYEVVGPRQHGNGYLMLSEKGFSGLSGSYIIPYASEKMNILSSTDYLFEKINRHTLKYLEKELAFFDTYKTSKTLEIKKNIEYLKLEVQNALKDRFCCIFKMSAGSGFHSITGDWQFDDFSIDKIDGDQGRPSQGYLDGKKSVKSRKIAIFNNGREFSLMGFVKMSVMDETRRQAEEAEQRSRSVYETAISEAEAYFGASNKSDLTMMKTALSNFERAAEILSAGGKHSDKIDSIKKIIAGLEVAQDQQDSEDKARQAAIAAGLTILEDKNNNKQYKVQSFKNVSDRVLGWLKKSKNTALPDNQDQYLKVTLSRLYQNNVPDREKPLWMKFDSKMWQEVIRWCGQDRAKAIFDSVMANKV